MRFQLEKTWQTALRLEKWKDNQSKFDTNGTDIKAVTELTMELKIQEPMTSLMKLKENLALSDEEHKIVRLKYQSPRLGSLKNDQLAIVIKTLLLKIHVITGWTLPSGNFMSALKDLFEKKLLMDYKILNQDEIEYAFLKYGTTIEDWGKEMNLNMIDKVLILYVEQRFEFSHNEENDCRRHLKKFTPRKKYLTNEEAKLKPLSRQ